nr:MAG TPA: hypothetical protein [Caudoviricetes sp.]
MAILSWYTKLEDESNYAPSIEKFIGTYTALTPLKVNIQLWNNRYGEEDTDDLKNFSLRLGFRNFEDSALLDKARITLASGQILPGEITGDKKVFFLPNSVTLSGRKNNGEVNENEDNFLSFVLEFNLDTKIILKENDLKDMYLEVVNS